MSTYRSMTAEAHAWIGRHLRPGGCVFDGTAGQGFDTLALAQSVAPGGRVIAVDLQPEAVVATQQRLAAADLPVSWEVREGSHAELPRVFPDWASIWLDGAIFNLGYLPGGDHALTTTASDTLIALDLVWGKLRPIAPLVVVCYPGHATGKIEAEAVEQWFGARTRDEGVEVESRRVEGTRRPAPFVLAALRPDQPTPDQ